MLMQRIFRKNTNPTRHNSRSLVRRNRQCPRFETLETRLLLDIAGPADPQTLSVAAEFADAAEPNDVSVDLIDSQLADRIVPGQVLVGVRTTTPITDVRAHAATLDWPAALDSISPESIHEVYTIPQVEGGYLTVLLVELEGRVGVLDAVAELQSSEFTAFAEPNMRLTTDPFESVPNDPDYAGEDGQYFHELIDTPGAWEVLQADNPATWGGEGVVVAVLDTGIDLTHEDLRENVWVNPGEIPGDGLDNDGNGFIDDVNGWNFGGWIAGQNNGSADVEDDSPISHGTHVAGIVAAKADNGKGAVRHWTKTPKPSCGNALANIVSFRIQAITMIV